MIAYSVMIGRSAGIYITVLGNGTLAPGTVLTLINNTGANPIAGVFSELRDNDLLTIGHNTYLASYEGGDGNDLTLTVQ